MNEITLNLIVLAAFVLVGGGIFYLIRRKQAAAAQEIQEMARANGWKYEAVREPLTWGTRLRSNHWTLECLSVSIGQESDSGSSNISMFTVWKADQPGNTFLFGPRTSQVDLGGVGKMLVWKMLQAALGPEASSLSEVRVGDTAFQQKYIVWAQDPEEVERLITPAFQSALLKWKGQAPLIKRTSAGLVIEFSGVHLTKTREILDLIRLCEHLIAIG